MYIELVNICFVDCRNYNSDKRLTARTQSSYEPKAVSRTYPSPAAPNPTPGVHAMLHLSSNMSKNVQESMPSGVFTQI